jgi:2-polyprenyl-3-methyl-5-hydroxy-6-metoxy-1,4-benzoquinol methylase
MFKSFERVLGPCLPADTSALILDAGCGEGALLEFLRHKGYRNLFGFDISPENVDWCHKLGFESVCKLDLTKPDCYPGPSQYDVIFAIDVLEHIPKQAAAGFLERLRESLRPGGHLILQTPNMACILGHYHRYADLSHEFCLTERTALHLLMLAGFDADQIEIRPAWNATTFLGYLREIYLCILHHLVFLAEGSGRPKIPTKNLLIRARR